MGKKLISDFIRAYSGVLSPARCEALIHRFEETSDRHEIMRAEGSYSFVQLDVTAAWPDVDAEIEQIMTRCYQQYRTELNLQRFWPSSYLNENLRLKRYLPDGRDEFPPHVDVMDQSTNTRFCTAIIYLNDPGGGGETIFPDAEIMVAPKPGNIVIFPPLWTFPHAGLPPRSKAKYILHSYLGYPRKTQNPATQNPQSQVPGSSPQRPAPQP